MADTYPRVKSISKPVTSLGMMKLAEQGKIKLDSPIKKYMKSWDFPESEFSKVSGYSYDYSLPLIKSACKGCVYICPFPYRLY